MTKVYLNEKQQTFKYAIEGWLFFLAKKFVLSMIIRIFAAREPAKPLNDAQMCGSFLFLWVYGNKNSVYKNIFHAP